MKTLRAAAATNDHRGLLIALRDRIIVTISADDCPPRDLAPLVRQLKEITVTLDAMDKAAAAHAAEEMGIDGGWTTKAV